MLYSSGTLGTLLINFFLKRAKHEKLSLLSPQYHEDGGSSIIFKYCTYRLIKLSQARRISQGLESSWSSIAQETSEVRINDRR